MRLFTGQERRIESLVFSPDGQHLACNADEVAGKNRLIQVWHSSGDVSPVLACEHSRSTWLRFAPDGRLLTHGEAGWQTHDCATGAVDPTDSLRSIRPTLLSKTARVVVAITRPTGIVMTLRAATFTAGVWRETWAKEIPFDLEITGPLGYHQLIASADETKVVRWYFTDRSASRTTPSALQVLDTSTGAELGEWRGKLHPYPWMGMMIASATGQIGLLHGTAIHVVDPGAKRSTPIKVVNTSRQQFTAFDFSPDGKLLATTSNDATVTMWDTATWQPIRQYGWDIGRLRAVAFAPDGLTCAAGSDTGKVVLFDVDG